MMDTLDVRGLHDEYIIWLQKVVKSLREQAQHQKTCKDKEIVFETQGSHLIDGYDRAVAYEP
ncbi:MAG: hypothetical protein OXI24_04575 [Candidatus Poribacteria bacterium]|nr:hypothetical protein [Candidatus Poribacteria bacterium]